MSRAVALFGVLAGLSKRNLRSVMCENQTLYAYHTASIAT